MFLCVWQFLPVEYGGKSSVPVCDSPEERHLRRLVDAINANANKANTHGNNDDVGTTSGKSKHTPSRVHRGKTSPSRSGKSTKVQDAKRNRSGKVRGSGGEALFSFFIPTGVPVVRVAAVPEGSKRKQVSG